MASLIKNQIIKHLSVFARNLTPDQISVEVLRGKGELKDIELNEAILTERLELPSWLKIERATCNRVSVKVPWTKLKTYAVELDIDEIKVVLSLSASPTPMTTKKTTNTQSGKPYDYTERVIEGLSINVQTLTVQFKSDCFGGSLLFQRLSVASKSPCYKEEKDLHMTRVHDKSNNRLLFFKQVSWNMCKIEASALKYDETNVDEAGARRNALNSPLRLIMHNGGKCNIAIKKNDLDCSVISARIEVHLDEILWVATLLQLRSAIDFYKHIQSLIAAAEKQRGVTDLLRSQKSVNQRSSINSKPIVNNPISEAFKKYDIPQSSHHLHITKIDVCLFDDSTDDALPEDWGINNGAVQAVLHGLRVDFYPSHAVYGSDLKFSDRSDWVKYKPLNSCREMAERHLENYRAKCENFEPTRLSRIKQSWSTLHSKNIVIRIEDIVVQCVSEQSTKKDSIQQLLAPSKLRQSTDLPAVPTISFFHMEFASYYFLASNEYPLPPDSTHLVMGPLEFLADDRSLRWMVYVSENILNAFDETSTQATSTCGTNQPYFCVEFVEPTLVLNAPQLTDDLRLPKRFLLNFSSLSACNFLLPSAITEKSKESAFSHFCTLDQLTSNCLNFCTSKQSDLDKHVEFSELLKRVNLFCRAEEYANSIDSVYRTNDEVRLFVDIPSVNFSSDFGKNSFETPITSDISLLAVAAPQKALCAVLARPRNDINVIIDHFQLVRLLQLQTHITNLVDQIDADRRFFGAANKRNNAKNNAVDMPLAIFCDLEKVNVSLILPSEPIPSPYDLNWSPPSMTMENVSDSIMTGQCSEDKNNDYVHSEVDLISLSKAIAENTLENDRKVSGTSVTTSKIEQQILTLEFADLRNSTSASSLTNPLPNRGDHKSVSGNDSVLSARSASFAVALPQAVTELRPPSRQVVGGLHRAEFSMGSLTSADIDRANIFDDTVSISTTTCDYQHFLCDEIDITSMIGGFGGGTAGSALGPVEDAELAEEADAMDERNRWADVERKVLSRRVNLLDASLNKVNVVAVICGSDNESTNDQTRTRVAVLGDASTVSVSERLDIVCGDVYKESVLTAKESRTRRSTMTAGVESYPIEVQFQVKVNDQKETLIEVNVDGAGKSFELSDEVVSHLGPFIENSELEEGDPNPPELRLNISNLNVQIKNQKKKHPLRIRLGSAITINDGPILPDINFP